MASMIDKAKMSITKLQGVLSHYLLKHLLRPSDSEQLIEILRGYERANLLDIDALDMIERVIQVSEMQVHDIMVPQVQMIVIKNGASTAEVLATFKGSGHSRFPVTGSDNNEVIGILLVKDMLHHIANQQTQEPDIKDMMHRAFYVPESKRLNILLREFRANRNHMAIVVDEYSGVAGLVTMEDIIEEIVGNIKDEHDLDDELDNIRVHGHNRYAVNPLTSISEFNEFFTVQLSDQEYDTIGGLILQAFGHVPARHESIEFEGFGIKVLRADKRRIRLIRVSRL